MEYLNHLIGMVVFIADYVLNDAVGVLFLGIGIFGFVLYSVRRLIR